MTHLQNSRRRAAVCNAAFENTARVMLVEQHSHVICVDIHTESRENIQDINDSLAGFS